MIEKELGSGEVVKAFGNLVQVRFKGNIRQGELALLHLGNLGLKGEVIEIVGDEAKVQVYEDTRDVKCGTLVSFLGHLLEAELGPGLLSAVLDGLQNPLEKIAVSSGLFLTRGVYIPPLDRTRKWDYQPIAKVGDIVSRGDDLGVTMESRFHHKIMVPFSLSGEFKLTWIIKPGSYTVDTVVAKGVNEKGEEHSFTMIQKWSVKRPLAFGDKLRPTKMLQTGLRIIDGQFPVAKGGSFCSPGPFGAGKTVMQHHLSKYASVDIVIIVACGERAGEVVEVLRTFPHLLDPYTSDPLMDRTVIICNTSSMPVSSREASIYMGATIAEYYRQMGLDVLLLADSTSRWAQAMREMSGRLEEIPGDEAFPAYLASRIASFYERSGVLAVKGGKEGSLTIGGTVSPAGGNFEEPVTQATLSVVGAFHALSSARSSARRYPAIDPLISWSKYLEVAAIELKKDMINWQDVVEEAEEILKKGDEIGKRMEVVGEEGTSLLDLLTYLKAELYDFCFLQQNNYDKEDCYCCEKRQVPLLRIMGKIFAFSPSFSNHDEARSFFLDLQNEIKNLNYMPFESERYYKTLARIEENLKVSHEKVL